MRVRIDGGVVWSFISQGPTVINISSNIFFYIFFFVENNSGCTLENSSSVENNSGGTLENNSSVENNSGGTLENNSGGTLEN